MMFTFTYTLLWFHFFAAINPDLWGDIAVSLLTFFHNDIRRLTDVMYETMAI